MFLFSFSFHLTMAKGEHQDYMFCIKVWAVTKSIVRQKQFAFGFLCPSFI